MSFNFNSHAQITKQQAIDIVMDSIVNTRSVSVNVYMDSLVQTATYYNLSPYDSLLSPYANYWLFFIDEEPEQDWSHSCFYAFINQQNGNYTVVSGTMPPYFYKVEMQDISDNFDYNPPMPDFEIPYDPSIIPDPNCNLYAVIFGGGNPGNLRFWNSMSQRYCALIEHGFPEDQIYVLSFDGTVSSITNPSLNLNNYGDNDILSCHSGGFYDEIVNLNNDQEKTVLTCTDWDNAYWIDNEFIEKAMMEKYNYLTGTALRGYHSGHYQRAPWARLAPIGSHPNFSCLFPNKSEINFDLTTGSSNGIFEIGEIIQYTSEYDLEFQVYGEKQDDDGFEEDLLSLYGITGKTENTQTLSGNYLIGGNLSIEPGVELTLDNTASFHVFDSEIIIKGEDEANGLPGGLLKLEGATLTNVCDIPWKGIQIWGNSNKDQYSSVGIPLAQGELIAKNALIENADIAVQVFNPADRKNTGGGIITATNTLFRNNERAVDFAPYRNIISSSSAEYDNLADFTNCDFIVDENYLHNSNRYDGTQVKIHSVEGIDFKACTFENKLNSNLQTGRGIHSIDAGFEIGSFNNENSFFSGFRHGIESYSSQSATYRIFIRQSDFERNGVGIYLRNIAYPVITDNNFTIGYNIGCAGSGGTGIIMENSKGFAIQNNNFETPVPSANDSKTGIWVINTNNAFDRVYKNNFEALTIANYAEGKNHGSQYYKGLEYICNSNQNNNWDFYVRRLDFIDGDGIQSIQGSVSEVAGNTFSNSATMHFENNGDYEVDYYYDNNSASEVPDANKIYRIKREPQTISNTCPNHYGGNNEIKLNQIEYAQRESDYSSALSLYNSAEQSYGSATDSTLQKYYQQRMSYFYGQLSLAAYDIVRSNMSDTIVQDSLYALWMGEFNTYASQETMVDFYLQKGYYTKAWNLADSLKYNFTFTSYDSIEYPYYLELKELQISWLENGRDIFGLNTSEISKLETIADSSRGTAGAQARGILSFAYDTAYFYTNCVAVPDTSQKSSPVAKGNANENHEVWITASPNPATSAITFNYSIGDKANAVLSLYNQNGILMDNILLEKGSKIFRYNCSNYGTQMGNLPWGK